MKFPKIKAVIFDMDGLMVESEKLHFKSYKKVLVNLGFSFTENDYWRFWGSDKDVCQRIVKEFNLKMNWQDLLKMKNQIFRQKMLNKIKARKGLFKLLKKLHQDKYFMAVASGSQMEEIKTILKNLKIGRFFKAVVSAEFVKKGKPSPDIFLMAAEKLDVLSKNCLVLEDSPKGVIAAKRAGMRCYAIPSRETKKMDFNQADKVLNSLERVCDFL